MEERIFGIKRTTWALIKHMAARSVFLFGLTVVGFALLEMMLQSGIEDRHGIIARYPEFMSMIRAAAIFTFVDMSVFWIRIATQPKMVEQDNVEAAQGSASGAAWIYGIDKLVWAFRVVVFIYLMGGV